MIERLIGRDSAAAQLKDGLTASSRAVRGIAHRVANGDTPGFSDALADASTPGGPDAVDLEREMVALADEQLRFEATSSLLQKVYAQVRSAIRER